MEQRYHGDDLRGLILAGFEFLRGREDELNRINVFPVPDADTGTNMRLTLQAVADALHGAEVARSAHAVAEQVAKAALIGAKGNSGVMLAQILRGISRSLSGLETFSAADFSRALRNGSDLLYRTVADPVEGTILTVVRRAADAAEAASASSARRLHQVLDKTVRAAKEAVDATPDLLPVLREAGVVDAGGAGLCYILEGMRNYVRPSKRSSFSAG